MELITQPAFYPDNIFKAKNKISSNQIIKVTLYNFSRFISCISKMKKAYDRNYNIFKNQTAQAMHKYMEVERKELAGFIPIIYI